MSTNIENQYQGITELQIKYKNAKFWIMKFILVKSLNGKNVNCELDLTNLQSGLLVESLFALITNAKNRIYNNKLISTNIGLAGISDIQFTKKDLEKFKASVNAQCKKARDQRGNEIAPFGPKTSTVSQKILRGFKKSS